MKDNPRIFLDTNLVIYAHTNLDVLKQHKIQNMITNEHTVISTQVLQEAANVLFKKIKFAWQDIQSVLKGMQQNNELHTNIPFTIQRACDIAKQYQFSFYDSLIVAAALDSGCTTLFSEDLQHGQLIEEVLTIKNPFL